MVLLRVVCRDDDQPQRRPTFDVKIESWRLESSDGRMENPPHEESTSQRVLSKALRKQGWFYVAMTPGSYFLRITPKDEHASIFADYYLSVPADKTSVYAGTVVFNRHINEDKMSRKKEWWAPGKTYYQADYDRGEISDETEIARNITSGFGGISPALLVSYGTPSINAGQGVRLESGNAGVAGATPVVRGDNWRTAGLVGLPLVYSGTLLLQAAGNGNGDGAGLVAVAGAGLLLVSAPVVLTIGGITTEVHHRKWAPYEAALKKQVAEFHLEEKLQEALAARLGSAGTNSTAVPVLRLEAQPYRIVLRGDEKNQNFGLEVAVHVRLSNAADGKPMWEHNYVCVCDGSAVKPYETSILNSCSPSRLEDYRGDSGARLLASQLGLTVEAMSSAIAGRDR